jgi:hypothetical protein
VQVYCPLERLHTADNLLVVQGSTLAPKLAAFLDLVDYAMQEEWGGKGRQACTDRMLAAAKQLSGCMAF